MILYIIGSNAYYQGIMEVPDDPNDIYGIPFGTSKKAPPELAEDQYAVWNGSGWDATTTPPPEPVPVKDVPQVITKYQAKMALLQDGLYESVEQYVSNSNDYALKISWYDATNFYRDNQFIAELAIQFNLTQDQVDDLFILANTF